MLSISYLISLIAKGTGKLHAFVQKKRAMFIWGGVVDYFNESFTVMSFSVIINFSHLSIENFSVSFNIVLAFMFGLSIVFGPIVLAYKFNKAWKNLP